MANKKCCKPKNTCKWLGELEEEEKMKKGASILCLDYNFDKVPNFKEFREMFES